MFGSWRARCSIATLSPCVSPERASPRAAQLQRLSSRRVLNSVFSGYSFDQIVLRAEQLADQHTPSMVIVGFIADDIRGT